MTPFICVTCGVQHAPSERPPPNCTICDDERQCVGRAGQRWATLQEMRDGGRTTVVDEIEPGLHAIETRPSFAIGQRAHIVRGAAGNLMWESVSSIDDAALRAIADLGGVAAIAISHPHFYSSMVEWSRALGGVPIWLHAADHQWVMRPDPSIVYWEGREARPVAGSDLILINIGGHFPGMTACLWPGGAHGRGALLSADMPTVAADRRWVSFMYSYPNMIPLAPAEVRRLAALLAAYRFDRLYSSWRDAVVSEGAQAAVARSAERYLRHMAERP